MDFRFDDTKYSFLVSEYFDAKVGTSNSSLFHIMHE